MYAIDKKMCIYKINSLSLDSSNYGRLISIHEYYHLLELQDALTLSEQTKTNLESELRVFESNIQNFNQQVARAEEKILQLSSQKEKLVSHRMNKLD